MGTGKRRRCQCARARRARGRSRSSAGLMTAGRVGRRPGGYRPAGEAACVRRLLLRSLRDRNLLWWPAGGHVSEGRNGMEGRTRTRGVHPRHLGGLSSDERTTCLLTTLRNAFDHIGGEGDVELAAGVVIEEVQRLCALHEQIVHGHGYQVDALRANPRSILPQREWGKHGYIPTVSWIPASIATRSFVPTPSVPLTSSGSA